MAKIEIASKSDIPDILEFLKENWSEKLIYVRNPKMFEEDFLEGDRVNFVIARDKETSKVLGVQGFIKYSKDDAGADTFAALWRALEVKSSPLLGFKIFRKILKLGFGSVSSTGINAATRGIYDYLGMTTGQMNHFYLLNPEITDFKIAKIESAQDSTTESEAKNTLIKLTSSEVIDLYSKISLDKASTKKDLAFFTRRYANFEYFDYSFWKLPDSDCLLITKIDQANGAKCMRVIDFFGEQENLLQIKSSLLALIISEQCEYIDSYSVNISCDIMNQIGFVERKEESKNIIPNYFSPFEQKNIDILYFTNSKDKKIFFKGDGDQDRPN